MPFPRGKKLFVAIGIIVSLQNLLSKTRGHEQAYAGSISLFNLTAEEALKKWALLQHYESQIPMLFGSEPDRLLEHGFNLLSTETAIAISALSADR